MSVVLLTEAFGEQFFRGLRGNGAFIGQGSEQVIEAVAAGDIAACLAVDYITFDKMSSGAPIALAYPPEMIVIPSPVAIFKDSPNTESAKRFADYLITPEAQRIIASIGTVPVLDGISVPDIYNLPPAAEITARAIEVNNAETMAWKDEVVAVFLGIMNDTAPLPDTEAIDALYDAAVQIFHWFEFDSMLYDTQEQITINANTYYKVTEFNTYSQLAEYITGILSEPVAQVLLAYEKFIDYEGALYVIPSARGGDITIGETSRHIRVESDEKIKYSVTAEVYGDDLETVEDYKTRDFYLEYDGERWIFTNFELVN
jgi:hypothetical protein